MPVLVASLVLATAVGQAAFAQTRWNVLFIAVDDLRPEMGCYGNPTVQTPHLDRLARQGVIFRRAYCQQAVCSPSRSSLLTGKRPDATRVWDLQTHFRKALPDIVTLPQYFKQHGYHCAALGKIYHGGFEDGRSWSEPHWYPSGRTVDTDPQDWSRQIVARHAVQATEYAYSYAEQAAAAKAKNKNAKIGPAFEISPKPDEELPDGATASEAVRRLRVLKAQGKPFFLAVGFYKPHLPFVAPKRYWDAYDPKQIPRPATDRLPLAAPPWAGHDNGELHNYLGVPAGNPLPEDFAQTLRHGYYACVSFVDAQIGRVLDALEAEGLADQTIVVLWGDHGWQLGDHGLWHKHTNFERAARAPLIVRVPGWRAAGRACDATVEFVDIYPTLADLCGLPIPPGLDGSSLRPFLENPSHPSQKVAISQYPRPPAATGGHGALMGYSIRDDRWRCTFWRQRYGSQIVATELYDEQNDPEETVNLADRPEHQGVIASLSQHLPPPPSAQRP
jgi:choline-sulfatase